MTERATHWEDVYSRNPVMSLSWFEREPTTSLRLIDEVASGPTDGLIDVGAGASSLVDQLVEHGFTDVSVLDVSQLALNEVRLRLGEKAPRVTFVAQDVLTWQPDRQYNIWHDRAVFHFLTEETDRERYVEIAAQTIRLRGLLLLATFAEDGATQCSGLPVARYSVGDLKEVFSASFSLVKQEREEHVTPAGVVQPFTWVVLRRG